MGYLVNFLENQTVCARDMNDISTSLGGVTTDFEDGRLYGVTDLNQISCSLIGKGVASGCGLFLQEEGVLISQGELFMSDGKRVIIDEEGILLPIVQGVTNYVWFYQDTVLGTLTPKCTQEEPSGEDFVRLGEITPEGEISGKSDRAVMKNSHLGLNHMEEYSFTYQFKPGESKETLIFEAEPEQVGCRFAIITAENDSTETIKSNHFCGYVDLLTGKSFGISSTTPAKTYDRNWAHISRSEEAGSVYTGYTSRDRKDYFNALRISLGTDNVLRVYMRSVSAGTSGTELLPYSQAVTIKLC